MRKPYFEMAVQTCTAAALDAVDGGSSQRIMYCVEDLALGNALAAADYTAICGIFRNKRLTRFIVKRAEAYIPAAVRFKVISPTQLQPGAAEQLHRIFRDSRRAGQSR